MTLRVSPRVLLQNLVACVLNILMLISNLQGSRNQNGPLLPYIYLPSPLARPANIIAVRVHKKGRLSGK